MVIFRHANSQALELHQHRLASQQYTLGLNAGNRGWRVTSYGSFVVHFLARHFSTTSLHSNVDTILEAFATSWMFITTSAQRARHLLNLPFGVHKV
jgi:hypothetical protein